MCSYVSAADKFVKIQFTHSLLKTHLLCKVKRAFMPEEPGKGLTVPKETGGARREIHLKRLCPGAVAADDGNVLFHFRVLRLMCAAAVTVSSGHTSGADRLSCWLALQLKPLAIWSRIKQVTVCTKTAVKRSRL